jgi:hypothetical protein
VVCGALGCAARASRRSNVAAQLALPWSAGAVAYSVVATGAETETAGSGGRTGTGSGVGGPVIRTSGRGTVVVPT